MVRRHGPFAQRNPWRAIALRTCAALTVSTALVGFVLLPVADRGRGESAWASICSAFGAKSLRRPADYPAPVYASDVRWTPLSLADANAGDAKRGAVVAADCAACHGAKGINGTAWIPNLAGLRSETTTKQLLDYKSGHRRWPVMNAIGAALSRDDIRDVAAYYASLKPAAVVAADWAAERVPAVGDIRRLVFAGDPSRGIGPCAPCHGLGGLKRAAPVLAGEQAPYVERQLLAFKSRARANDEGEQMRVVAAMLHPDEIARLAEYLGAPTCSGETRCER